MTEERRDTERDELATRMTHPFRQGNVADDVCACGAARFRHPGEAGYELSVPPEQDGERLPELQELWLYQIPEGEENGLDGYSGTPSGLLFYTTTEAGAEQIRELGYPIEKVVPATQLHEAQERAEERIREIESRIIHSRNTSAERAIKEANARAESAEEQRDEALSAMEHAAEKSLDVDPRNYEPEAVGQYLRDTATRIRAHKLDAEPHLRDTERDNAPAPDSGQPDSDPPTATSAAGGVSHCCEAREQLKAAREAIQEEIAGLRALQRANQNLRDNGYSNPGVLDASTRQLQDRIDEWASVLSTQPNSDSALTNSEPTGE